MLLEERLGSPLSAVQENRSGSWPYCSGLKPSPLSQPMVGPGLEPPTPRRADGQKARFGPSACRLAPSLWRLYVTPAPADDETWPELRCRVALSASPPASFSSVPSRGRGLPDYPPCMTHPPTPIPHIPAENVGCKGPAVGVSREAHGESPPLPGCPPAGTQFWQALVAAQGLEVILTASSQPGTPAWGGPGMKAPQVA